MTDAGTITDGQTPDRHTLAWWRKQFAEVLTGYRGATHAINRCLAEYADCYQREKELRADVEILRADLQSAEAEIGRLKETLAIVAERQDKIANWLREKSKTNGLADSP
jgi:flagellar motility protein MotE (MotC chaperone)